VFDCDHNRFHAVADSWLNPLGLLIVSSNVHLGCAVWLRSCYDLFICTVIGTGCMYSTVRKNSCKG